MSDQKKYSRRIRMYKEDYISVCVYLNVTQDGRKFYDTVVYRKIQVGDNIEFKRGANLKPKDIPVLLRLLKEASDFLEAENAA